MLQKFGVYSQVLNISPEMSSEEARAIAREGECVK